MAEQFTVTFDLTRTDYDHGFGSTVTHTLEARPMPMTVSPAGDARIEGSLSVQGIALKPGQKIKAVFTVED